MKKVKEMKSLQHYVMALLAMAMPIAFAACGDDDSYSAGPEVSVDCPSVYFSSDNNNIYVVDLGDNGPGEITLKVEREQTAGALTVPLVVDKNNASFSFPESVSFNDGEKEASLIVKYDEYVSGMSFTVRIADEYANPYTEKDGSYVFSLTVTQPYELCTVTYSNDTTYSNGTVVSGRFHGVTDSKIYAYSGLNKFLWTDFFGSGVDVAFTVDTSNSTGKFDSSDLTKLNGDIVPLDHYTANEYGYSLVTETGTDDYVTWTPAGSSDEITLYFYGYYSAHYSYIDFEPGGNDGTGYGYLWSCYVYNGYENVYFYLHYTEE